MPRTQGILTANVMPPAAAAVDYAARGLRVLPVYAPDPNRAHDTRPGLACTCPDPRHGGGPGGARCPDPGKHPRITAYQTDASTDPATVADWWQRWPGANIGLAMGGPDRLIAIDVDGPAGLASLARLEAELGALPVTLTTLSCRDDVSGHRIYEVPPDLDIARIKNRAGGLGPGLDIRTGGGQIVAPPSLHATGRRYRWACDAPVAELPAAWYWRMALPAVAPPSAPPRAPSPRRDRRRPASAAHGRAWADAALTDECAAIREAPSGTRNPLASKAGYAIGGIVGGGYLTEDEAYDALLTATHEGGWNQADEDKTRGTLRRQMHSGMLAPRHPPPLAPGPNDTPWDDAADAKTEDTVADYDAEPDADPTTDAGESALPPQVSLDDLEPSASPVFALGDHEELARTTLAKLGPNPLTFDVDDVHEYGPESGVWSKVPGERIRNTVASFSGATIDSPRPKQLKIQHSDCVGVEKRVRDKLKANPARITFAGAPTGTAFRNGFVRVEAGVITVEPHAPTNRARHAFQFDYAPWYPSATPLFCDLLDAIFADCSEDERAAHVACLQEVAGACLAGDAVRYQKALFFYGEGSNGKSTVLTIFRAMFPDDARATLAPQRWSERFAVEALEGRRVNLVSETPTGEILDGSVFKAVVTGDEISAERKNRDVFKFIPIAGHIFSLNSELATADQSEGFWRRVVPLWFTRSFEDDPARALNPEAPIIRDELGGVMSWAIEGAARAQRQCGYTIPERSKQLKTDWRDNGDAVRTFVATRPVGETIRARELFDAYKSWAKDTNHGQMSNTKFATRLKMTKLYTGKHDQHGTVYTMVRGAPVPVASAPTTCDDYD